MIDRTLIEEAESLADGADIHDVHVLIATYRSLEVDELVAEFERELRAFVARKRLERLPPASNCQ